MYKCHTSPRSRLASSQNHSASCSVCAPVHILPRRHPKGLYTVEPSLGKDDYHLTTDITNRAIEYITGIKSATPDRPFFGYFATGAVHAPHHAPDSVRGQPMAGARSTDNETSFSMARVYTNQSNDRFIMILMRLHPGRNKAANSVKNHRV